MPAWIPHLWQHMCTCPSAAKAFHGFHMVSVRQMLVESINLTSKIHNSCEKTECLRAKEVMLFVFFKKNTFNP